MIYLKCRKGETQQPRILYPERISFRFDRDIKSFTDKKKLKRVQPYQTSFTRNDTGTSLNRKEKATTRYMKNEKGKISLIKANIQ